MAVISVRSGVMVFGDTKTSSGESRDGAQKKPLRVLVIGDFAGAAPRAQPLAVRKHLRVDADTFDQVFVRLGVSVKLPFDEEPIRFSSLEEMHPDHLFENVSLFNRYRSLRKQLQSPTQFDVAVASLAREGLIEQPRENKTQTADAEPDLLDAILSGSVSGTSSGFAEQLIRQTIAPYLQPKEHPKVPEYLAAVDAAMAEVMRKIMHADAFQALEASWRSLDFLQRRLDLDRDCELSLLDVSIRELAADIEAAAGDFAKTALHRNLTSGDSSPHPAYDVVVLDHLLGAGDVRQPLAEMLLSLGESVNSLILAGGTVDFVDAVSATDDWRRIRQHSAADQVFIASSRLLLRLPYGKRTAVIDQFAYEELPQQGAHDYYLWGNGAYLMLVALLQSAASSVAACHIQNLPLHVYRDEDGDEAVKPCAEVYLTEKQAAEMEEAGFTVLHSVQKSNSVMIQRWRSIKA